MSGDLLPIGLPEMIAEVERELEYRRHVYARMVHEKKLNRRTADRRSDVMRAVRDNLVEQTGADGLAHLRRENQELREKVEVAKAGLEKLREMVLEQSASGYENASFPERACDYCGKTYRGPAVYCSLECAKADSGA